MAARKKTRSKTKAAPKKAAPKKAAPKKAAPKKKAAPMKATAKKAAPKRVPAKKAAPKATAKKTAPKKKAAPKKAAPPRATGHMRDATGHLDPKYEAGLLERSGENAGDERAFIGGRSHSRDDLAEQLGEGFVEAVTTGEPDAELEREEKEEDDAPLA
jgi:hypothetical protein